MSAGDRRPVNLRADFDALGVEVGIRARSVLCFERISFRDGAGPDVARQAVLGEHLRPWDRHQAPRAARKAVPVLRWLA